MITERHPLDIIIARSVNFEKSLSLPFKKRATILKDLKDLKAQFKHRLL